MAKGQELRQKSHNTKVDSTRKSSVDVKRLGKLTKSGQNSTTAEEPPSAGRSLLAHFSKRRKAQQKVPSIVLLCLLSLMVVHRLLADYQLEVQNWLMGAYQQLQDYQPKKRSFVPNRMLLLLMVLQSSEFLPIMQLALQLLFLAYIPLKPMLFLLATKIMSRMARSKPLSVQHARKPSVAEETKHTERFHATEKQIEKDGAKTKSKKQESKFQPNGNERSKQNQPNKKHAMMSTPNTVKDSLIHKESLLENEGTRSKNAASTSKGEQPSVSLEDKETVDNNANEQTDLDDEIVDGDGRTNIGANFRRNGKRKRKRNGRKDTNCGQANVNKPEDMRGINTKQTWSLKGLRNLGNTCFFNAVMQNLNQSFVLSELLSEQRSDLPLTKSMIAFYQQMRRQDINLFNPSSLFQSLCDRSPRFKGGHQHDSHELLRHILDGLRNEEREASLEPDKRKILTKVDKVFGGHFMTVYICNRCIRPYNVCEPFLDISLPIEYQEYAGDQIEKEDITSRQTTDDELRFQKSAKSLMTPLSSRDSQDIRRTRSSTEKSDSSLPGSKRKRSTGSTECAATTSRPRKRSRTEIRSVLDFLDAFTRIECITNEYLCMACHEERVSEGAKDYQMTSATKRTLVFNPPALLTLHLKRFKQTARGFVKCNDMVTFPDMLDLSPYCSSQCMRNDGNEKNIWYSLYGVVAHDGDISGGHYYAYIKVRTPDANIIQFLQQSFLDHRELLTETKLVEMMNELQIHLEQTSRREWRPLAAVKGTWFYISDCQCSQVPENDVWQQRAYLLFYERMTRMDSAV